MAIQQSNDGALRELALFAGAGGGILGGNLLGWRTICAVECDAYCAQVLAQRQNDGCLEPFPVWSDVRSFDGKTWRGRVDVISGGFPCQDISAAGRGAGIEGERSGLWSEFARIIGEVRPRYVFVENSPILTSRGLGVVLGDLAAMGYDAEWGVLGARDVGAPHQRDRIWIVAYSDSVRELQSEGIKCDEWGWSGDSSEDLPDTNSAQREGRRISIGTRTEHTHLSDSCGWTSEPDVGRVANGVAHRLDRLKAIGNGQVSRVAATAFTELLRRLK